MHERDKRTAQRDKKKAIGKRKARKKSEKGESARRGINVPQLKKGIQK
jgi:hypothetical protein